jgi:ankyrin repeat protein
MAALASIACDLRTSDLPKPPTPVRVDGGYPTTPRPRCSKAVMDALRQRSGPAIMEAAKRGENFTCDIAEEHTLLDDAVLADDVDRVRALLEAGADPNARTGTRGDHFPLQWTIDYPRGIRSDHSDEIVSLLLAHRADPNMRWCPFESRGPYEHFRSCSSNEGHTLLIAAAIRDRVAVAYRLLDAGADPWLEDWSGQSALDYTHSEPMFWLIAATMFRNPATRRGETLEHLASRRPVSNILDGPWVETPLSRALHHTGQFYTAPPPPLPRDRIGRTTSWHERVAIVLSLGADPNQRLSRDGVDWTPLGLAISSRAEPLVQTLLDAGADPNARWCVQMFRAEHNAPWQKYPGCRPEAGVTPLMWAASLKQTGIETMLLNYGADPNATDWVGRTYRDFASHAK